LRGGLIAAATGVGAYDWANWVLGSIVGKLVLLGYTWALIHHMLGGFRHFMWDLGYGFDKHFSTKLAKLNIIASLCLTLLVWVIGFVIRF
jgi:succinate dehydrogenase / fumarate reductase cytochrome b subunit